jgi:pilus assembly protein Flp/PilA
VCWRIACCAPRWALRGTGRSLHTPYQPVVPSAIRQSGHSYRALVKMQPEKQPIRYQKEHYLVVVPRFPMPYAAGGSCDGNGPVQRRSKLHGGHLVNEQIVARMLALQAWIKKHLRREEGQGLVEYALILALIAVLVIVALKFLQPTISNTLNNVSNTL